ncbi:MAG: 2-phospho-L-lactate guanylyltransferase [Solirubrobacterales bacterium]
MIEAGANTFAVLPVKRPRGAKSRMAGAMDEERRIALVEAMLEDVLEGLDGTRLLFGTIVVTGDEVAAGIAKAHGCQVVDDPDDGGHSEAALVGIAAARDQGAERVLLVPGDCPLLSPREMDRLLGSVPERFVAIVPDRHGTGTNALLLSPTDAIEPAFGEGSAQRHLTLAREAGVPAGLEERPALALDLDTPADIVALQTKFESGVRGAKNTAKVLDA